MLKDSQTFSSFSTNDLAAAKKFYGETLGLETKEEPGMGLGLKLSGGSQVFIYPKEDHQPASFTVLNFIVADIDKTVADLKFRGVQFEHYTTGQIATDELGVARGRATGEGPDIAWFKDPAGNYLSVLQEK